MVGEEMRNIIAVMMWLGYMFQYHDKDAALRGLTRKGAAMDTRLAPLF